MPQIQNKHRCIWCGTKTNYKDGCHICKEKLRLIKTIKAMLLGCSLKELDEREKSNEKNNIKRT